MIVVSDNIATNMLIDYLGWIPSMRLSAALAAPTPSCTAACAAITGAKAGYITPRDMGRFFALLAKGELVSPQASDAMRNVFRQQHYNTMLAGSIPRITPTPKNPTRIRI